jgi:alkylation response protein AidB-like acyl-CoA dehydrogenase
MANLLTEDQIAIKELIRDFMKEKVKPHLRELDEKGEFPQEIYQEAYKLGLHCLQIPEQYGGAGLDFLTMAVALEEMGRGDPGFAITMLSTSLTLKCILWGATRNRNNVRPTLSFPVHTAASA